MLFCHWAEEFLLKTEAAAEDADVSGKGGEQGGEPAEPADVGGITEGD